MAFVRKNPHPKTKKYRAGYTAWNGEQIDFVGTTNKNETLRIARNHEDKHTKIRLGDLPPPKVSDTPREFASVVTEYLAWGKAKGGHGGRTWSPVHMALRTRHLSKFWPEQLNAKMIQDVTLAKVEAVAQKLQDGKMGKVKSGKTIQSHVESIKALCLWAKERRYLDSNPLEGLTPFDTTPVQTRRAMLESEIAKLLDAAPQERRLVYEVALYGTDKHCKKG